MKDNVKKIKDLLCLKYGFENREEASFIPENKKTDWPSGLWKSEPDEVTWKEATSFGDVICLIRRNTMGSLCGYVDFPTSHPYGKETCYSSIDINCHGGLTYLSKVLCQFEEDRLRLGFDCAHSGDFVPGISSLGGIYRNIDYVVNQIKSIIRQLELACPN